MRNVWQRISFRSLTVFAAALGAACSSNQGETAGRLTQAATASDTASQGVALVPSTGGNGPGGWNSILGTWGGDGTPGNTLDFAADFDGDGRVDLLNLWNDQGSRCAQLALSNGNAFEGATGGTGCPGQPAGGWNSGLGTWLSDGNVASGGPLDYVADVNGDGKADLVNIWNDNGTRCVQLALSSGTGFEGATGGAGCPGQPSASWNTSFGGWGNDGNAAAGGAIDLVADFNGDGKADLLNIWDDDGIRCAALALSNGNGFSPATGGTGCPNQPAGGWNTSLGSWGSDGAVGGVINEVADFTGDGKADIVSFWNDNGTRCVQLAISNGNGFDASTGGTGCPGQPAGGWNSAIGDWLNDGNVAANGAIDKVADVNGDHKADLVNFWDDDGTRCVQLVLATGNGFEAATGGTGCPGQPAGSWNSAIGTWLADTNGAAGGSVDLLADMNGDGMADLVNVWNDSCTRCVQLALSSGSGFSGAVGGTGCPGAGQAASSWNSAAGGWSSDGNAATNGAMDFAADFTGTGRAGLITVWDDANVRTAQAMVSVVGDCAIPPPSGESVDAPPTSCLPPPSDPTPVYTPPPSADCGDPVCGCYACAPDPYPCAGLLACPPPPALSPLVLNFGSGPIGFVGHAVPFDFLGDGTTPLEDWIGPQFGILARPDKNGNVTAGWQLFGTETALASGGLAANGFAALAQYDANADGVIDAKDPIFSLLALWFDANSNGVSDPGEVVTLASKGVTSLVLADAGVDIDTDATGSYVGFNGTFGWTQPNGASTSGELADVYFAGAPGTDAGAP